MKATFIHIVIFLFSIGAIAQYSPGFDEPGSDAIHKDSSIFKSWATECILDLGYINIEDTNFTYTYNSTTSNHSFFGNDTSALGMPGIAGKYVSLGDGGSAILSFEQTITNGAGPDFAVFENGFKAVAPPYLYFLELAYVEVSTDGITYVRFPSVSLTQDTVQIASFNQLDPSKIHNLAGKHITNYGTPFDLEDLKDSIGIDIDSIRFVKIIDVVGCIQNEFANYDSQGHKINEPWPTPFNTGGFDLDAVGVINHKQSNVEDIDKKVYQTKVYPNPANDYVNITGNDIQSINIHDINGKLVLQANVNNNFLSIDISNLPEGVYIISAFKKSSVITKKLIVY